MKQFRVLFKKEWMEAVRDLRWIWMPIVFILIGIMEPITTFYTPQIIEQFGSLPEGTIIEIPLPTAEDVLVSTAGQYNLLGVLVIVLAFMGILAGERKSGTAAMVLVKPVSFKAFVAAKWLHGVLLVWVSFLLGMSMSWYYTDRLFGLVPVSDFFTGSLSFGLWLTFIFTIILFFSSFSPKPGIAAFGSLATVIVLTMLSSILPEKFNWSPFALPTYASKFWLAEPTEKQLYVALIISIILIYGLIILSINIFKRKELA
ncbi:ABC transporter permease [Lederbergia citrea]|uniref:ABC transporter permease n=1 Tax=Lederbergia citrea TaxID=2833581 RepID=UPI001BC8D4E2|nr:ABC transporter permease subunit [Lederbergia citrea]MBS4205561.1 ABC transporter permease subunit [Lederbergia citrea]